MSNRDYTNYSKQRKPFKPEQNQNGIAVVEEPVVETEEIAVEVVKKVGVVTDCLKLNVREKASTDSDVVCVIDASSEIVIDEEASTDTFYKICTAAGVEGFCMKQYITLVP